MQAKNTIIDNGLYDVMTSPLYKRVNLKENDIYTTILPQENKTLMANQEEVPQMLTFNIPPNNWADTVASCFSWQIGIPFTGGVLTDQILFQKDGAIYRQKTDLSTAPILIKRLPLQSQSFFRHIRVKKTNKNAAELNFEQREKFRENQFVGLTGQEWINRCGSSIVHINNNTKILYTGHPTADTTTMIYVNFTLPLGNASPLFGVYPYFPFALLNSEITVELDLNTKAWELVGDKYINFKLQMQLVRQGMVAQKLKNEIIHGVFPDYKYDHLLNRTYAEKIDYIITQNYNSLDQIQVQAFKNMTNDNYYLGYSNISEDSPYVASKPYLIGDVNFEHDSVKIFMRKLETLEDVIRQNFRDGHQLSQYNNVSTNKTFDFNFYEYVNQFKLKLNDDQYVSTTTTGFTGLQIKPAQTDTTFSFDGIYDYSLHRPTALKLNTSDVVNYEFFFYHSKVMTISNGDIIIE